MPMHSWSQSSRITDLVRRGRLIPATDTSPPRLPPSGTATDSDGTDMSRTSAKTDCDLGRTCRTHQPGR